MKTLLLRISIMSIGLICLTYWVSLPRPHEKTSIIAEVAIDAAYMANHNEGRTAPSGKKAGQRAFRWSQAIGYSISFTENINNTDLVQNYISTAFDQFSTNTGIYAADVRPSNFFILFRNPEYDIEFLKSGFDNFNPIYQKRVGRGERCFGMSLVSDDDEIVFAMVIIDDSISGRVLENCIFEEIFNMTGLTADPKGFASLLDKYPLERDGKSVKFSATHEAMLKSFYYSDISKGIVSHKQLHEIIASMLTKE